MLNIKSFYFNPFEECCTVAWDSSGQAVIVDPGCFNDSEIAQLEDFVSSKGLKPSLIALTHAHFDHIFGVSAIASRYGVPVVMDPADKVIVDNNRWFCMNFGLKVPDNGFAEGEWKPYSEWKSGAAESQGTPGDGFQGSTGDRTQGATTEYRPLVLIVQDGDVIEWGEGRRWEVLSTPGHTPGGICFLDREAKLLFSGDTLFAGAIGRTDNRWGDYDALIAGIFRKLMVLDGDINVIPGHGGRTTIADERAKNPFLMPFNEEYQDPDA